MKSRVFVFFAFVVFAASLCANTVFENPQLHSGDSVLFSLKHNAPGEISYSSLAVASAVSETPRARLLTSFPEKIEFLRGGEILQIRNRYGSARYFFDAQRFFPATFNTLPQYPARLEVISVSPDGRWMCFIKRTSAARGNLMVRNTAESTAQNDVTLAQNVDFSFERVPAKWSPDSTVLVYERAHTLFFIRTTDIERRTILDEPYRTIGRGLITSVVWPSAKTLVYIDKDIIYSIPSHELYTRALYASFVGSGSVIGKLSWNFNAAQDSFWVNAGMTSMILLQKKQMIFSINLVQPPYGAGYIPMLSGYATGTVPANTRETHVFWNNTENPFVWFESEHDKRGALYTLSGTSFLKVLNSDSVWKPAMSPGAKYIAFISSGDTTIFDAENGVVIASQKGDVAVSLAWKNNNELVIGGMETIRLWNVSTNAVDFLLFSSVSEYGRDEISGKICVRSSIGSYAYDELESRWVPLGREALMSLPELANGFYRVYVGESLNSGFGNALFIRKLSGSIDTRALFPQTASKPAVRGKVVLVFDALDEASGLGVILRTLASYNLRSTFFINGEFIRRYPARILEILGEGHACASMFFAPTDLNSDGFMIDDEFIKRGLARNEDEFFYATGKELELFWHTPNYEASAAVKKAGREAGYTWVNKGLAPPDRTTLEDAILGKAVYHSAAAMIDTMSARLASQDKSGKPASFIIPISVGIANGTRGDYLYEKLDVLISAIIEAGYEIVNLEDL